MSARVLTTARHPCAKAATSTAEKGRCIVLGLRSRRSSTHIAALLFTISLASEHVEGRDLPVIGDEVVVQLGLGSHTYYIDNTPQDESAGMFSVTIGFHLSERFMLGIRSSFMSYERMTSSSDEFRMAMAKEDISLSTALLMARWRFRANDRFQPYVDLGFGRSNALYNGTKDKAVLNIGFGFQAKLNKKWALGIESRGIAWSELYAGKDSAIASGEAALQLTRFI